MQTVVALGAVFIAGAGIAFLAISGASLRLKREQFIREFVFPASLLQSLRKTYPALEDKDIFLAARALRQYFLVHARSRGRSVGMPSRVVDALWHDFILDTKAYAAFCSNAFGSFFHHIPASKVQPGKSGNEALRLTWKLACLEENIDPRNATRLPLLFAIDSKLKIPDGHTYDLAALRKAPDKNSAAGCAGFGCSGSGSHGCNGSCNGGCSGGCGGH